MSYYMSYVYVINQVVARWHPEDACRPVLEEAPVFHPTEEVLFVYELISPFNILGFLSSGLGMSLIEVSTPSAGIQGCTQVHCNDTSKSTEVWNVSHCSTPFLGSSVSTKREEYLGKFKVCYSYPTN